MDTITCMEITKFVLDESHTGVLPEPLVRSAARSGLRLRYGLEAQESKHLYVIRAWDTSYALHDLTCSFSEEANLHIDSIVPGVLDYRMHVHLQCEPYTALASPLTEIVVWNLREGAQKAVVEALLTKLMGIVNTIPFGDGMYKAGWGHVTNDESKYVVMIGWTTLEAFFAAVQNSPAGRAVLDELDEFTVRHIRHVPLNQPRRGRIYEARL
ncbi:hypothetical protein BDW22DRAFT_1354989 [Trametopsis cervina]|nr:hypothetical protein BDW22DRAFT_1354989 [Trametopsis cervina]